MEDQMKNLNGILWSLTLICGGAMCSAQNSAVPFRQIEHDAQYSAKLMVPDSGAGVNRPYAEYPIGSSASGAAYTQPAYKPPRTLDTKFFFLNGIHVGLAALDIGLTQHCIATHRCREGNPFMPSSFAGQVGVNSALISSGVLISYRLKKQQSKVWWVSPFAGIVAHATGAVSGMINQ
jgi:hypothetical protein